MRTIKLCVTLSLLSLLACSSKMPGMMGNPGGPTGAALAAGLKVSEVAFYQGPKSSLMKDGASVTRDVPVVQGRDGLIRIFVSVTSGWTARDIRVRLEMTSGGTALAAREKTLRVTSTSTEADFQSTVNFEIPADQITADTTWSVTAYEGGTAPANAGSSDAARFPGEGEFPLDAGDTGESLKVVVIPVRYDADGSGRLPDTSTAQLGKLRTEMQTLYPVRRVDITVGAEFPWAQAVSANGTGWDQLLNAIVRLRQKDGAATNVYYYGMFTPAASLGSYCGQGCVLGLSPLSVDPSDDYARGSIGLGYGGSFYGDDASSTFVHEVGHAHGRQHAPCQLGGQSSDPDYPYSGGKLGVWAWDIVGKVMKDPAGKSRDMMGYCQPIFISDYNYKALYDRISYLNTHQPYYIPGPEAQLNWRTVIVRGDQMTAAGEPITLRRPPGGESRTVEHVGLDGRSERIGVKYYPFDHLDGGIMLVPESYSGSLRSLR